VTSLDDAWEVEDHPPPKRDPRRVLPLVYDPSASAALFVRETMEDSPHSSESPTFIAFAGGFFFFFFYFFLGFGCFVFGCFFLLFSFYPVFPPTPPPGVGVLDLDSRSQRTPTGERGRCEERPLSALVSISFTADD